MRIIKRAKKDIIYLLKDVADVLVATNPKGVLIVTAKCPSGRDMSKSMDTCASACSEKDIPYNIHDEEVFSSLTDRVFPFVSESLRTKTDIALYTPGCFCCWQEMRAGTVARNLNKIYGSEMTFIGFSGQDLQNGYLHGYEDSSQENLDIMSYRCPDNKLFLAEPADFLYESAYENGFRDITADIVSDPSRFYGYARKIFAIDLRRCTLPELLRLYPE